MCYDPRVMLSRRSTAAMLSAGTALVLLLVAPAPAAAGKCEYKVAKGDTLSRIAKRKGVSEAALIRANPKLKKNPNRLRVGQTLKICSAKSAQATARGKSCGKNARIVTHKVTKGQTVGAIAARYSVSRDSVRRFNKKLKKRKNNMIRVGESLRICTTNRRYTHRSWLKGGVQMQPGDGYNLRRPDNAWGTKAAVNGITTALAHYHVLEPDAPLVQVGDISRSNGGPLRSHMSHQDGRDVDIGYVYAPREDKTQPRKLDLARTWTLIDVFVNGEGVSAIFMAYKLQRRLYEHAKSVGVSEERLNEIFEYPREGDHKALIYHWPGHAQHFHVRYKRSPKPAPTDKPTS